MYGSKEYNTNVAQQGLLQGHRVSGVPLQVCTRSHCRSAFPEWLHAGRALGDDTLITDGGGGGTVCGLVRMCIAMLIASLCTSLCMPGD